MTDKFDDKSWLQQSGQIKSKNKKFKNSAFIFTYCECVNLFTLNLYNCSTSLNLSKCARHFNFLFLL